MKKFWQKYKDKLIQIIFILLGVGGYATFDQLQSETPTPPELTQFSRGLPEDVPTKSPLVIEQGFRYAVLVSVSREVTQEVELPGRPGFEVTTKDVFVKALFFKNLSEINRDNIRREVEHAGIVFEDIVLVYPMFKTFRVEEPS